MATEFTPWASLAGGVLIGIAATLLMLFLGRIMGVTGILSGLMQPASAADFRWRLALLAGMVSGPGAVYIAAGEMPALQVPVSLPLLLLGGVLVGIGVTYGSGCTSGHGICGMARLSPRSIVATVTFMLVAFVTVFLMRQILGG